MLRLAVFASGAGSNLEAIYNSIVNGLLQHVELALVVSNNSTSGALAFARKVNIHGVHLSLLKAGNDENLYEKKMIEILHSEKIDIIALAGYMKKLPFPVIEEYKGKIVNIHPALLPEFGGVGMFGLNVHNSVIASGKKISGATVHLVESEYDSGEIIIQETCPVKDGDTAETLAERIKIIEHRILPKAIGIVADRILH